MRHQKTRNKLSRDSAHRKSLLMNLSKEIIEHERIKTSEAKAKAVKPEIEKLITLAKRGDLHARRQALSTLSQDKFAVHKLFEEVAPRYADTPGRLHAHPQARSASQRRDRDGLPRARLKPRAARRAAAQDGHQAHARVRRDRLRRLGAPAGRAHRPGGARAGAAHGPRRDAARTASRSTLTVAGRTDRGRARLGAGGELRARGGRPAAPERRCSTTTWRCSPASPRASGFDARRDATSRTYCYRVLARRTRSVFERGRAFWWPRRARPRRAAASARARCVGRHDFTAFTPTETEHTRFHCTVSRARSGAMTATCSSSGSRRTCSCGT